MKEYFLTPIEIPMPPPHTQIHPRCFTCKKFPVCNLREDYLKTALLIQNILGDPQEDRELDKFDGEHLHGFKGYDFENPEEIFPQEVTDINDETGTFLAAKWRNFDVAQFIYIFEKYYVRFDAIYNKDNETFEIKNGHEVYYHIPYSLNSTDAENIILQLGIWREEMIEKEKEKEDPDIINTTYFSAILNCKFYDQEKGLSEEEGIRRIIAQFPDGIPCKDGSYYHLATFHIEPHKVPKYNPYSGKIAFAPMPYPVFVPKPCKEHKKPPRRRDDCE